ncbi:MAG: alpha/beta fold hydrolase [Acidobacteriaceae bacterium]|nr:alpha/beta fold hydrolase [Acidobacteriaceae bacterium]
MPDDIVRFEKDSVRGFLHQPATPSENGLVLTHGAGANCTSALLVAVANAFCGAGMCVLRFDLPFRVRRAFGPPHPSSAIEDRSGIRAALDAMRSLVSGPVFAGGHSYGGRQVTLLAAEVSNLCEGLLLLSYPLHPPDKPAHLRTAHFGSLRVPAYFVHGTNDPFGSPQEITAAVRLIPSRTGLTFVDRAGHDLSKGRFAIDKDVIGPFRDLCSE